MSKNNYTGRACRMHWMQVSPCHITRRPSDAWHLTLTIEKPVPTPNTPMVTSWLLRVKRCIGTSRLMAAAGQTTALRSRILQMCTCRAALCLQWRFACASQISLFDNCWFSRIALLLRLVFSRYTGSNRYRTGIFFTFRSAGVLSSGPARDEPRHGQLQLTNLT